MPKHQTPVGPFVVAIATCLLNWPMSQAADFHFTLMGNSMLTMGIDFGAFSRAVNHEVEVKSAGAGSSLWKLCTLWYVCKDSKRPKYALIEVRGTELTDPMHWNTYGREAMGSDPELQAIIAKVEADPPPLVSGNHDFAGAVNQCYLPYMIQVARSRGIDLIIARHKAPSYLIDENSPHDAWWDTVMKYRQDLANYCQSNGVFFLDYQFAPAIKFSEHYIGPGDDHLNAVGKAIWTSLLAADVRALLAGRRGANECTSFRRVPGEWEWQYGLSARDGLDESGDADRDGLSNYAEYAADTNPIDATSALRFVEVALHEGRLRLTWQGGAASVQRLEARTVLGGAPEFWSSVRVYLPPTPATNAFLEDGGSAGQRFYRLRAERP